MEIKKRKRGRPKLSEEEKKARAKARAELKKSKEKEKADKLAEKLKTAESIILTPRGKCPVPLFSVSEDAVAVWLKNLKTIKSNGKHTVQSVSYWIRDFYSVHSEEHRTVEYYVKMLGPELGFEDHEMRLKKLYRQISREIKENKDAEV